MITIVIIGLILTNVYTYVSLWKIRNKLMQYRIAAYRGSKRTSIVPNRSFSNCESILIINGVMKRFGQ